MLFESPLKHFLLGGKSHSINIVVMELRSDFTWRLHHGLHVLLLQLLDALSFRLAVLLQAANFVHVLVI